VKLSCLPVSYYDDFFSGRMSVSEWAREASELGLDAIDLHIGFVKSREPDYLKRMRQEIEATGLQVAMVTTYSDFTHPDPDERAHQILESQTDIRVAAELGAELVRITAGQAHPETAREEGIAWVMEGLTQALAVAEREGVRLVFENHEKPTVWQHEDFSRPTDIFLQIVKATASTSLGVNFDTANPLIYGYDPLPLLKQVLDRVVSVHAADTGAWGAKQRVVVGTGLVPFRDVFTMLKAAGFEGWICLVEWSGTGRGGFAAGVDFIRRLWAEVSGL
jgi:sugar phosphate isomerase/epimerase